MDQEKQNNNFEEKSLAIFEKDKVMVLINELKNIPEHLPEELKKTVANTIKERIEYYTDRQEAMDLANSNMLPKEFDNNPHNAVIAFRKGRALGLNRYQSIEALCTINGHTRVWGDTMLAIAMTDPRFIDCNEMFGPDVETDEAHGLLPEWTECTVKMKGREDIVRRYRIKDAKKNPNWNNDKVKTWKTNGRRMMQFKSRAWALRDAFPDRLGGMYTEYEIEEIQASKDITDQVTDLSKGKSGTEGLKSAIRSQEEQPAPDDTENQSEPEMTIEDPVEDEEPKEQESTVIVAKPANIDEIKSDFNSWKARNLLKPELHQHYVNSASEGKWDIVVELHEEFKNSFVVKLSQIVDNPDFKTAIQSLIDEKKIVNTRQTKELRTQDEETAERVYNLIIQVKGFEDAAKKEAQQQTEAVA